MRRTVASVQTLRGRGGLPVENHLHRGAPSTPNSGQVTCARRPPVANPRRANPGRQVDESHRARRRWAVGAATPTARQLKGRSGATTSPLGLGPSRRQHRAAAAADRVLGGLIESHPPRSRRRSGLSRSQKKRHSHRPTGCPHSCGVMADAIASRPTLAQASSSSPPGDPATARPAMTSPWNSTMTPPRAKRRLGS